VNNLLAKFEVSSYQTFPRYGGNSEILQVDHMTLLRPPLT